LDVSLAARLGEIMSNGLRPFHKPPNRILAERTENEIISAHVQALMVIKSEQKCYGVSTLPKVLELTCSGMYDERAVVLTWTNYQLLPLRSG
jgi:non-ribosomal peptide synthetase component F